MQRKYRFANTTFLIEFEYKYTEFLLFKYKVGDNADTDEYIKISKSDIELERKFDKDAAAYPDEYLENIAVFRQVAEALINRDTLTFHGSAICFDNKAYIFAGKSGSGKSTYAKRCIDSLGGRAYYINDDKPLLRFENEAWTVYGTPWNGKHNLGDNVSARLGGICFMCDGKSFEAETVDSELAFQQLLGQAYRSPDPVRLEKILGLVGKLKNTAIFKTDFSNEEKYAAEVLEQISASINDALI